MTTRDHSSHSLRRREMLKRGAAFAGSAALPGGLATGASAAPSGTLVIAAPATPQSLDSDFDVSLGTFEAIGALYEDMLGYEKIPDPERAGGAARGHRRSMPDKPNGLAMRGKLAETWELDPRGKAPFKLREGVMSNWGNEFTAEDVKWTWDRKFELKGARRLLHRRARPERPDRSRSRASTPSRSISTIRTRCC